MKRENLERAVEIEDEAHFLEADIEEIVDRDTDKTSAFSCLDKNGCSCEVELSASEERIITAMLIRNRRKQLSKILSEMETL